MLTLLFLLQSIVIDVCPKGQESVQVPKGTTQNICFTSVDSPVIKWFRLKRSPVPAGLFVHYQQILPTFATKVLITYQDLDKTYKNREFLRINYSFPVFNTYYYCVSTVYDDAGVQRETLCSNQFRIEVQK